MNGKFVFLGTGSSLGVPVIGCHCHVCSSQDPKNQRMRAGGLIEVAGKRFLIDAGPDVRRQALLHKIEKIDGFILTHAHYDHVAGFDDLKVYKQGDKKLSCLMLEDTWKELRVKYHYFIHPTPENPSNSHFFSFDLINESFGSVVFETILMQYVTYVQANMRVMGIRIGNLAYISDIKEYEDEIFTHLKGVEILIISALRDSGSPMHFSVQEALAFSETVGASKVYFTHIAHEMDYKKMQGSLPSHVTLAYDGLSIPFHMDNYGL